MDGLYAFLEEVRRRDEARGNFLGLLNVLIGRRVDAPDGSVISSGLTWRALAQLLKRVRWDKESVRQVGLDPKGLPPRDRVRYWYAAISLSQVHATKAKEAGDRLAESLQGGGYRIIPGPRPASLPKSPATPNS
jgi:hypothetical protein